MKILKLLPCEKFGGQEMESLPRRNGSLILRKSTSPRSYPDPQQRAPACSPNCRYEIIFVFVSVTNILHLLICSFCHQIKQMMEAATKQIEERKKQLTFSSSVTSPSVIVKCQHFQGVYLSNKYPFPCLTGGCLLQHNSPKPVQLQAVPLPSPPPRPPAS